MKNQLLTVLINLGLTDKEAKVYLACRENGVAVVSTISKTAGINRVTTYDILEKLKQKKLVSSYTKNKIRYFNSINPEILLEQFEKRTSELRTSIPKFKALTGETNHPRIKYFEGLEGIKEIYIDTLNSKSEILNFSNSYEIRNVWPTYDKDYVEKRSKRKIFLKGICPKDSAGEEVKSKDSKFFREMRLIPVDHFNFTNEINIYDDKVAIISFKDELIGMIIESTEIANSQRAIFNMCWEYAELLNSLTPAETRTKMLEPIRPPELQKTLEKVEIHKEDNLSLF